MTTTIEPIAGRLIRPIIPGGCVGGDWADPCGRPIACRRRRLCATHERRLRRGGDPTTPIRPHRQGTP